ncbi:MAG: XylR family transcriptional regulator [Limisphaerales bacterium]
MQNSPKVILIIESSRASGRALLRGIADYSHLRGPWSFSWEPGGLESSWLTNRNADAQGIILRDVDKVKEVLACGLPVVVIGHQQKEVSGVVNVLTDSETIGRLGADHLIGCGFKHFAYCGYTVSPLENAPWSAIRLHSYASRLKEKGFSRPMALHLSMDTGHWEKQKKANADWLRSVPRPVGLMACNDDCGRRVMELCKMAGLAVPDEVGVIGVDNDEVVCGLMDPPMSSIAINFERAGYEAAAALARLMQGEKNVPHRIIAAATHVVGRRSTDFVAAEDMHLRKALVFIRDHARIPISVSQVASASGLSRRSLEKAFRRLLGRSVLDEIRRSRADQIARLLVETDLSVAQIAETLGFVDVQHVARYFRTVKQISPTAYRKAYGMRHGPALVAIPARGSD